MSFEVIALHPSSQRYPARISSAIKGAALSCIGHLQLLDMKAIGICGSRNASAEALRFAYEFGAQAARRNFVVVSGYARGVDREAHKGALESGGSTIAVLPEGIEYFKFNRELKLSVNLGKNFLAVSMFPPRARWQAWRAMERNKLIVGLSSAMLVIEARDTGGTIHAGWESIRQGKKLWVVDYQDDTRERAGGRTLIQNSGMPLNIVQVEDIGLALDAAARYIEQDTKQLAMELV